jgi:hypothetical protein
VAETERERERERERDRDRERRIAPYLILQRPELMNRKGML